MAVLSYCSPAFGGGTIHNQIGIVFISAGLFYAPLHMQGKIYAKNLKFSIAAVFVVCQRDSHI